MVLTSVSPPPGRQAHDAVLARFPREVADGHDERRRTRSRGLNDDRVQRAQRPPPVEAPTRDRVLAAVEQLGYEVNLTARHLKSGRTDTVALIVPSLHDYYSDLADQIAPLVEEGGRHLVLERTGASPQSEIESLSVARLRMYDGVLLSVAGLDRERLERVRTMAPIVLLGEREVPDRFDHVQLANEEGARLATAHMLAAAPVASWCSEVTQAPASMATLRRAGWQTAHREAGLPPTRSSSYRRRPTRQARGPRDPPQPARVRPAGRRRLRGDRHRGARRDGRAGRPRDRRPRRRSGGGVRRPGPREVPVPRAHDDRPEPRRWHGPRSACSNGGWQGADDPPEHVVVPVRLVVRGSTRA